MRRTKPSRRRGGPASAARSSGAALARSSLASSAPPPRSARPPDGAIVASVTLLAALGVVMIYSATAPLAIGHAVPPLFVRHLAGLVLAVLAGAFALRVPTRFWRRVALPAWATAVALLAATLVAGISANGAQRWLALPLIGVSLQPAELAKWSTALAAAATLAAGRPERWRPVWLSLALAAPPIALLLLQPNLSSAVVLVALVGALLFVAGVPLRRLALLAAPAAVGLATYIALRPYALARWRGFLSPWQTAQAEGFQLVQSFVAFGRGGSLGVGLGDGRQKLFYLPEAHTDFVLSVVAEELGLAGVLVVLGAFAALAFAGMRIAWRARDPFASLLAFAMTLFVALPAAINAAVVMGCLPTTGFTLPFLSFGSNSLLFCGLAIGILLRVGVESRAEGGRA